MDKGNSSLLLFAEACSAVVYTRTQSYSAIVYSTDQQNLQRYTMEEAPVRLACWSIPATHSCLHRRLLDIAEHGCVITGCYSDSSSVILIISV